MGKKLRRKTVTQVKELAKDLHSGKYMVIIVARDGSEVKNITQQFVSIIDLVVAMAEKTFSRI